MSGTSGSRSGTLGLVVYTADGDRLGVVAAVVAAGLVVDAGERVYVVPHAAVARSHDGSVHLRLAMAKAVARRSSDRATG